jgi:hypothetical protein
MVLDVHMGSAGHHDNHPLGTGSPTLQAKASAFLHIHIHMAVQLEAPSLLSPAPPISHPLGIGQDHRHGRME